MEDKMTGIMREVNNNDLDAVLELYLFLHEKNLPEKSEQLLKLWNEIISDKNYQILVCEIDGKIVSSCTLVIIKNLTRGLRPYALIENVVTKPEFRKRGIASALLGEAVKRARLAGCYKIMLMTGAKDDATKNFYRKAGFNSTDKTAFIKWL